MKKLHATQQDLAVKTRESEIAKKELEILREKDRKFYRESEKLSSENEVLTKLSGDLTQEVRILRQAMLTGTRAADDRILKKVTLPEGRMIAACLEKSLGLLSRTKREIATTAPHAVPAILKIEKLTMQAKMDIENFRMAAEKLQAVLLRLISREN